MIQRFCAAAAIFYFGAASVAAQTAGDSVPLRDGVDSLSYIIGRDVGSQLDEFGADIRMPSFSFGVQQAIRGGESLIDSAKADSIRRAFAGQVQEHLEQQNQEQAEENRRTTDSILQQNRQRNGVRTTSSGLQYQEIRRGRGPRPSANDSVEVMYRGIMPDSTVFDSTAQPVGLNLQATIPGLAEGIQLMSQGSVYRFWVPPQLAYGEQGIPPVIPPNALLIFDVELRNVVGRGRRR